MQLRLSNRGNRMKKLEDKKDKKWCKKCLKFGQEPYCYCQIVGLNEVTE